MTPVVPAIHDAHRVCVAPMLNWTDRHCRYLHRLLTRHALLYTEMVTTSALLHGDVARHLRFDEAESPVALQLGGSDTTELARCARLAAQWGYREVNLNCGCPSPRVQRGAFGACLMDEPALVADGIQAMQDAALIPVTVKHRIGLDQVESYDFVRDFVGTLSMAGCRTFIVHARNAWLNGLSPKENRTVPPLRHDWVYRLKRDFPRLEIVLNGGVVSAEQIAGHLRHVDGVMVGRSAYHRPGWLSEWDDRFWPERANGGQGAAGLHGAEALAVSIQQVTQRMVVYMLEQARLDGTHWSSIARHLLGLRHGLAGARHWRRVWSDHSLKHLSPDRVMALALQYADECCATCW